MSDIQGRGYGSAHDWRNEGTIYRATHYRCRVCGAVFVHHYPTEPAIFGAMFRAGIPEKCATAATETTTGSAEGSPETASAAASSVEGGS